MKFLAVAFIIAMKFGFIAIVAIAAMAGFIVIAPIIAAGFMVPCFKERAELRIGLWTALPTAAEEATLRSGKSSSA